MNNYSGGLVLDPLDIIQKLLPGESKEIKIPIFASEMMISEKVLVSTYITEYFGYDVTSPNVLTLDTKSLTSPELILTDIKINDQNNKNGLIEPAEIIEATMYVRNKGQQVAKDVNIAVLYGDLYLTQENLALNWETSDKIRKRKFNSHFFCHERSTERAPHKLRSKRIKKQV